MRRPVALSVDLDDTLSDSEGILDAVRRTCDHISQASGLDASEISQANVSVFGDFFPTVELNWVMGEIGDRELRYEVWLRTFRALGMTDESLLGEALSVFATALPACLRLYDDVPQFFDSVEGIPLALLTNAAGASQREKIEALGISGHFDVVVIAGDVGLVKPNPEVFMLTADRLDVSTQDMWHIGDSLATDVAGANKAGCGSVWLNRSDRDLDSSDPQPDKTIVSLSELNLR